MSQTFYLNYCCGQMGNHILAYNNLCQIAWPNKETYIIEGSEIPKYFKNIKTIKEPQEGFNINAIGIRNKKNIKNHKKIVLVEKYLGELFFYSNKVDPRTFLEVNDKYKMVLDKNKTNIGIHLRKPCNCKTRPIENEKIICTCISKNDNNLRKIYKNDIYHDYDYLVKSINYCTKNFKNCKFIIFGVNNLSQLTDKSEGKLMMDNFPPYRKIIEYLNENKLLWEKSITLKDIRKEYMFDFSQLSECDVIISSLSTFCFGASITGKKDKHIIFNKRMVEITKKLNDPNDIFWFELFDGGNEYYKVNKYI